MLWIGLAVLHWCCPPRFRYDETRFEPIDGGPWDAVLPSASLGGTAAEKSRSVCLRNQAVDRDKPSPNLSTTTSTFLLNALKGEQNQTVWRLFVDRYRPLVFRYARKLGLPEGDAEDAAQQTMVAFSVAYRGDKYDREKGRLRHWLFGIARNEIRNAIRNRRNREAQIPDRTDQTGFFEDLGEDGQLEAIWEEEWRQAVLRQCLEEARQAFEPRTIEAFELYAWKGWSARRVGEQLGMSENAVFLAKHKVLKRIRELVPLMEEAW